MTVFTILLWVHIISGSTSLITGSIVMILKKGGKYHKTFGKIYYFSMLVAVAAAIPMCFIHPNLFLFIISIFSGYMTLSGRRYVHIKSDHDVSIQDWILAGLMAIFGTLLIGIGVKNLLNGYTFGIVLIVLGIISITFVIRDYKNFTGQNNAHNFDITTHIQRMIGSYIASTTAFIVVNNTIMPNVVAWLIPTLIFLPLIIKYSRKWKKTKKQAYNIHNYFKI